MRNLTLILAVVLLLAVLIFAFQNRETVAVSFIAWSISVPKVFLILGTFVLGMASGSGLVLVLTRRS